MPPSVIIVGAGPAGLAAGACVRQRGVRATIIEASDAPGTTWRNLYDRLHLHTVKQFSGLPGLPMPRSFPRYPTRLQVVDYLSAYAKHFDLNIHYNSPVTQASRVADGWQITTPQGEQRADVLISATGIFSNPFLATYPGMSDFGGRTLPASAYHNPASFAGQRVLVIGAGNSGAEIAVDLAEQGVATTIAIRVGVHVVPRDLLGVPIQRWAHLIAVMPHALTQLITPVMLRRSATRQAKAGVPKAAGSLLDKPGVPVIGLDLLQHTQAGDIVVAGAIERFTPTGVLFTDGHEAAFDAVILATGYRPALGYLADAVPLDANGRPNLDGVRSLDAPHLYFVGMNYNIRGTLFTIAHEAPLVARMITG